MGGRLHLDAAASTRQGVTAFIHQSDDRVHVDVDRGLFLVADALGPRYGGYHAPLGVEVALRIVAERLKVRSSGSVGDAEEEMRAAFAEAGTKMFELDRAYYEAFKAAPRDGNPSLLAAREIALSRLGRDIDTHAHFYASISALRVSDDFVTVAQIGSCRAYRLRAGTLSLLMSEHAVGERNTSMIACRMLGAEPQGLVDLCSAPVEAGDRYLLCSDGLWNFMEENRLLEILHSNEVAQVLAARLVKAVAQADGTFPDDTSAVVVCVGA